MQSEEPGPRHRAMMRIVRRVVSACLLLLALFLATWAIQGPNPPLQQAFGLSGALSQPIASAVTVTIARSGTLAEPPLATLACGGTVTFANEGTMPATVRTTPHSQGVFTQLVPAHQQARQRLTIPGLYHYYNPDGARVLRFVAGNDVVIAQTTANQQGANQQGANQQGGQTGGQEGWIVVLCAVPGLQQTLTVPSQQDLFTPKAIVSIAGSTVVVANHDTDAHNFVIDPASPTGAAFIVSGSDNEPPSGWQRALVVEQPGLYHVYCTLHTRIVAVVHGWHIVAARPAASGYADHDPMDAWIVVLPATTRV